MSNLQTLNSHASFIVRITLISSLHCPHLAILHPCCHAIESTLKRPSRPACCTLSRQCQRTDHSRNCWPSLKSSLHRKARWTTSRILDTAPRWSDHSLGHASVGKGLCWFEERFRMFLYVCYIPLHSRPPTLHFHISVSTLVSTFQSSLPFPRPCCSHTRRCAPNFNSAYCYPFGHCFPLSMSPHGLLPAVPLLPLS